MNRSQQTVIRLCVVLSLHTLLWVREGEKTKKVKS